MHGLSINLSIESLKGFKEIIPCGLDNVKITCLQDQIDQKVDDKLVDNLIDDFTSEFIKEFEILQINNLNS